MLKPRFLFLIDGIGAFATAFLLYVVLRTFNVYIGMPPHVLMNLSVIAIIFSIYSFSCFLFLKNRWKMFLIVIGIANLFYCFLTGLLVFHYYPLLTALGVVYFSGEMLIILALVYLELKAAGK